jgi:hypothetical protein
VSQIGGIIKLRDVVPQQHEEGGRKADEEKRTKANADRSI